MAFDAWAGEAGLGRLDLVKLGVEGRDPEARGDAALAATLGDRREEGVAVTCDERAVWSPPPSHPRDEPGAAANQPRPHVADAIGSR